MGRFRYIVALIVAVVVAAGMVLLFSQLNIRVELVPADAGPAASPSGPIMKVLGWVFGGALFAAVAFTAWAVVKQVRRIRRGS